MPPHVNAIVMSALETETEVDDGLSGFGFDRNLYGKLPPLLEHIALLYESNAAKDAIIGSFICLFGSLSQNAKGTYAGDEVLPNLYFYLVGFSGSGKSVVADAERLIAPIMERLENDGHYWDIPADSTKAGMMQLLSDSNGRGIIVASEADTLTGSARNTFGGWLPLLRVGYNGESVKDYRSGTKTYRKAPRLNLGVSIASTPDQIPALLGKGKDGLFSRFCFLIMPGEKDFLDVFSPRNNEKRLNIAFLAEKIAQYYWRIADGEGLHIKLSKAQQERFIRLFRDEKAEIYQNIGAEQAALVNRRGLMAFKLILVLSIVRCADSGVYEGDVECTDADFNSVMLLMKAFTANANIVAGLLDGNTTTITPRRRDNIKDEAIRLYNEGKSVRAIALQLGIPYATMYYTLFGRK